MSLAPVKPGRVDGDPIGSEKPRGKDSSQRKSRLDGPSWTPTEQHIKNNLMRQFMKNPEGPGGVSDAFRVGWVRAFGRRLGEHAGALEGVRCDDDWCWCNQEGA